MMAGHKGSGKITGIRHIVSLKWMLQKWQGASLRRKVEHPNPLPATVVVSKRMTKATDSIAAACDSDDNTSNSPVSPPVDVPKGYLAVHVGPEHRRFVIPTAYLQHPAFKVLLEKAEEEFGFHSVGALTFPCEVETFKYILRCTDRQQNHGSSSPFTSPALQQY